MSNAIVTENALTGSSGWIFSKTATTQIQAYAGLNSVDPGSNISFYVSTQSGGTTYTITIFRMGYYAGLGGRLVATISGQVGVAQGYWDGATLTNCPTAIIDSSTHLCDANWASSYTWTVPSNACTGVYMALFTDANGWQWACTFVVRQLSSTSDYVCIRPILTDAAYNSWGGYSLYTSPTVGVKVSLNRPNYSGFGEAYVLDYELQSIKWMESQGYDLSYITNIDLHTNASQLLNHKCAICLGHDEYWTREMRDGFETAISSGVSAAFFGANACSWQVRLEADHNSIANRTVTCYKVTTAGANLATDPFYGVDNTRVTSHFNDAVVNRPQYTMIGLQYGSIVNGSNVAWRVEPSATYPALQGTGLVGGTSYGSDLVGNEYDKLHPLSPANYQIISTTSLVATGVFPDNANTIIYTASSGAVVFATGSLALTWALDSYRYAASSVSVVPGIQTLFANIMAALIAPRNQQSAGFRVHK